MQWSDRGLVIGARPHGEAAAIVELMTREHGRHLGLVHGARSRRMRPVLQAGNLVHATWRARIDEQLGTYAVEADVLGAARLLSSARALAGLATLASHLRLLPERDPHPELFDAAETLVGRLDDVIMAASLFVRFEVTLLAELGFGLDLASCAATGTTADLAYVSPKSGRAVSRVAGEPYHPRLLLLPPFLMQESAAVPAEADLQAGFRLTGFFLATHLYGPAGRDLPDTRGRFAEQEPVSDRPFEPDWTDS